MLWEKTIFIRSVAEMVPAVAAGLQLMMFRGFCTGLQEGCDGKLEPETAEWG